MFCVQACQTPRKVQMGFVAAGAAPRCSSEAMGRTTSLMVEIWDEGWLKYRAKNAGTQTSAPSWPGAPKLSSAARHSKTGSILRPVASALPSSGFGESGGRLQS